MTMSENENLSARRVFFSKLETVESPICRDDYLFNYIQNVKMWAALYAGMITHLTTFIAKKKSTV